LRAKFTNDSNFLVCDIGRGRDVEERSLEMTEVSQEGGRMLRRHESGLQIFWEKGSQKFISPVFKWQQIRRWDMTCHGCH